MNEPTRQPMAWRVPTHETPVPFLLLGYEPRFDRSRGSDLEPVPWLPRWFQFAPALAGVERGKVRLLHRTLQQLALLGLDSRSTAG